MKLKRLALSAVAMALPLSVALTPVAARAVETPPNFTLLCAQARSRLATDQGQLASVNARIAAYQSVITSLQITEHNLIVHGLGESPAYVAIAHTISTYQSMVSSLTSQRGFLQWQIFEDQWSVSYYCFPFAP